MFPLLFILIFLVCCSAFFSGSETAIFSLSHAKRHSITRRGTSSSNLLAKCIEKPRELLVTILLSNEFINVLISIVGASIIDKVLPFSVEVKTIAAVVIITPIVLIFGEITPKNFALHYANVIAPIIIWPLSFIHRAVKPLRVLLTKIADRIVRYFGGDPSFLEPMIMEDEFRRLVDLGKREGVIIEEERELIHNVFEFGDKVAVDIMTPANKLFSLSIDLPYERIIEDIRSVQFSRVPFYQSDPENIIGILHVRDLFALHRKVLAGEKASLRDVLRPPIFIAGNTPLESLLREFQKTRMHMAIVKDDHNQLKGLVAMHDVLEELFGEME